MKRYGVALMLCTCATVCAADNSVSCTATGQGATQEKAIQAALVQAVSKVHGVVVSTDVASVDVQTGGLDVAHDTATGNRRIGIDAVSVQTAGTITLTQARGLVKTYDVKDQREVRAGLYEVTLEVQVYTYQSPEDVKPVRLAVMPVTVQAATCRFGDRVVPGQQVAEQFIWSLMAGLTENERFTLLDRDSAAAIARERQVLADADVPAQEKVKGQATLGADYLVTVSVSQAELLVKETVNPAIGLPTREFDARVQAEVRVLVGPTRQVKMADDLRLRLEDNQIKGLASRWRSDEIDYAELQRNLIRLAAGRVAVAVADCLNPVRVAAMMEGGQVVLNQGGKRFVVGDQYEVTQSGPMIRDPVTGKDLASHEEPVGVVAVVKVLPRICYAKVVRGTFDARVVGATCRRAKGLEDTPIAPEGGRGSGAERTSSGGVKLPFDR